MPFFGISGLVKLRRTTLCKDVMCLPLYIASHRNVAGTKKLQCGSDAPSRRTPRHRCADPPRDRSAARARSRGGGLWAQFQPADHAQGTQLLDDVPALPAEVRERLRAAVEAVDPTRLPVLTPHVPRAADRRRTP